MNSKKRLVSWVLATLMTFSLIPVSVSATETCEHADYNVVTTLKEADCANGIRGIRKLACELCEYSWYEQYENHDMVQDTIDATCTEPEKVGEKCSICGTEGETTVVEGSEALGHEMVLDTENEEYVAATCEEGGVDTFKCSRCDAVETKATEALGHAWDDGVHQDATCESASGVLYTCGTCGATKVDEYPEDIAVPALKHVEQAVEDIEETCESAGWTGKVICSVCGEVLEEGEEVPVVADAHVSVLGTTLKEATCEQPVLVSMSANSAEQAWVTRR